MAGKKTLVIGASVNAERYSNKAIKKLNKYGHEVVALGNREGVIEDTLGNTPISKELLPHQNVHSVTLYLSSKNQENYLDYILSLKPKRVIFNPGTENTDFYTTLEKHEIEHLEACTLVMLSLDSY